jgi:ABC-2 type transport system permease protein
VRGATLAVPVGSRAPSSGALTGTGALLRFGLRRERWGIVAWALGIALATAAVPLSYVELYPTAAERNLIGAALSTPAAVALMGVNRSPGDYHYGAMTAHQMLFLTAILVGVMSALMTVRHTRQEEATGRAELVRSAPVGRLAPTVAALLTVLVANLAVGLALALALGATGVEGVDWPGSWLYGAAHVAAGLSFAGVAALASQVYESPRGAVGASLAAIGLAYLLRAAGDLAGSGLSWLSPLGWAQATGAFAYDSWAPLLPALAFVPATLLIAQALAERRDLGAGLWRARPGPAEASRALTTPAGLSWRLLRGTTLGWASAGLVMGAMYGAFLADVESMLGTSGVLRQMLRLGGGIDPVTAFASLISAVMAVILAAYTVLAMSRLRGEELAGRAEALLSTALSRGRWLAGHAAVVALGSTLVLLASGLGLGLAGSASLGDLSWLPRLTAAGVAYAPALWVVAGLAALLFGAAPSALPATWGLVGLSFVVIYLGGLLQLPAWLRAVSPFEAVPGYPLERMSAWPLAALTAVAALLVAAGAAAFRRRDVPS